MSKKKLDVTPIPLPVEHLLYQWGKAIRAQRQKARIPMRDFAYRINVSLDTLQRMEKGELSVQASSYLNAMLTLGVLDNLCPPPNEALMTSMVLRVRKKSKDEDDYF